VNTAARIEALEAEVSRLKRLIGRYAIHVGDCEGTYFLSYADVGVDDESITEGEASEIQSYIDAADALES
jgi:hypothetical protein